MSKAVNISLWVLAVAGLLSLFAFERYQERHTRLTLIKVDLEQPGDQLFLSKEDIIQNIENEDDSLKYKGISAINTALLEESLENHPFIAGAEVFSTLDGLLSVHVKQKEAVARVITSSRHYYLDAEGHAFPTTQSFSARVPVITGTADSTNIGKATYLLTITQAFPYFSNWLAELHFTDNNQIEIIPIAGKHRVLFGDTNQTPEKLKKLQAFYSTVVNEQNLDEWKTLNVAYNNQLVSTKHTR